MPSFAADDSWTLQGGVRRLGGILFKGAAREIPTSAAREPMHIIGAGFGRTGTASLMAALKQLGLKVYHMREGVIEGGQLPLWVDHVNAREANDAGAIARSTAALLEAMSADGFNATTDFPACLLIDDLLAAYPNARVVLSVRRSGDQWATSVLNSIAHFYNIMQWRFRKEEF